MERIESTEIRELAKTYGTPLYAYSRAKITDNFKRLTAAFSSRYPKFMVLYAVKANLNLSILKLLKDLGAGADCNSPGELAHAVKAGFDSTKTLYTGNYESADDLKTAVGAQVLLNLDSEEALDRALKAGPIGALSFRVNPGIGKGGFAEIVTGGEDSKFGIPFEKVESAYRKAIQAGVKRLGIHMHTGSNILDPADFSQIVERLMGIAGPMFNSLGVQPEFIDVGGGLGIPYTNDEKELDLDATAEAVTRAFRAGVEKYNLGHPTLVVEPGRFLVANAGWLISSVTSVKESYRKFVGLDAGMQTLLRPALYGAIHRTTVVGKPKSDGKIDLCGQICESTDVFFKDLDFPKVAEGDLVVFHDAGAYGFSMASTYNGRLRPAEVLVDGATHRLVRRREKIEDLFTCFSEL